MQAIKVSPIVLTGLVLVGSAALAAANPSMLPEHPGYPSSGEYANDTGQKNLTVEQSLSRAAVSEDAHTGQELVDPYNARLLESQEPVHCRRFQGRTSRLSRRSLRRLAYPSSSTPAAVHQIGRSRKYLRTSSQ